jgi:hypothetical protein
VLKPTLCHYALFTPLQVASEHSYRFVDSTVHVTENLTWKRGECKRPKSVVQVTNAWPSRKHSASNRVVSEPSTELFPTRKWSCVSEWVKSVTGSAFYSPKASGGGGFISPRESKKTTRPRYSTCQHHPSPLYQKWWPHKPLLS